MKMTNSRLAPPAVAGLCLILAGCGGGDEAVDEAVPTAEAAPATEETYALPAAPAPPPKVAQAEPSAPATPEGSATTQASAMAPPAGPPPDSTKPASATAPGAGSGPPRLLVFQGQSVMAALPMPASARVALAVAQFVAGQVRSRQAASTTSLAAVSPPARSGPASGTPTPAPGTPTPAPGTPAPAPGTPRSEFAGYSGSQAPGQQLPGPTGGSAPAPGTPAPAPGSPRSEFAGYSGSQMPGQQPPGAPGGPMPPTPGEVPQDPGAPYAGGPGGAGAEPPNFRYPATAVMAFLNALKARDPERLAEATALRSATEAAEKNKNMFKAILDKSLPENELNELATALEGYNIVSSNTSKTTARFGIIMEKTEGRYAVRRTVQLRREKLGWKVLDIGAPTKSTGRLTIPKGR